MFENKNMKKVVIWLTSIAIICFGIGFLIFNITGGNKKVSININTGNLLNSKDSKQYKLDDKKSGSINGISEVSIESTCADINIIPQKRSDVKVHMYGSIDGTYEPKLYLNISDGILEISTDKERTGSFSIFSSNLKLDIFIPENYNKSLKAATSSGSISLKNKISLKDVSIISTSGSLNLKDLTCENLEGKSTSGAVSGNSIIVNSADINNTSGTINLSEFKGDLNGETISGKITVDYSDFNNNVELKSISGNIELDLPGTSQFKIKSKSISGKIGCKFPVAIESSDKGKELIGTMGSDRNKVILNTTSGNSFVDIK